MAGILSKVGASLGKKTAPKPSLAGIGAGANTSANVSNTPNVGQGARAGASVKSAPRAPAGVGAGVRTSGSARYPVPSTGGGGGGGGYAPAAGGGGGGGALGATATGQMAPVVEEPVVPTEDEWYGQDSTYLGEDAALQLARDQAIAGLTSQKTNYQKDFGGSLRNLGYGWQDANNDGLPDDAEIQGGKWDRDNMQGAYGQAFKNQTDDFTGRGMLGSTFYNDANTELDRGFNQQFTDLSGARQQYLSELGREEQGTRDNYAASAGRARAESAQRRRATFGLG